MDPYQILLFGHESYYVSIQNAVQDVPHGSSYRFDGLRAISCFSHSDNIPRRIQFLYTVASKCNTAALYTL